MKEIIITSTLAITIVLMICITIVTWAYIAYNPKACPAPVETVSTGR